MYKSVIRVVSVLLSLTIDDVDRFNMFWNKSCMNPSFNYKVWPEYILLQLRRMNVIQWIKKSTLKLHSIQCVQTSKWKSVRLFTKVLPFNRAMINQSVNITTPFHITYMYQFSVEGGE